MHRITLIIATVLSLVVGVMIGTTSAPTSAATTPPTDEVVSTGTPVKLHLTGMWACDDLRIFRVRYREGDVAVDFRLEAMGVGTEVGRIGPGEEQFIAIDTGNTGVTAKLLWTDPVSGRSHQQVKQSNNNQADPSQCPGYIPPATPDPVAPAAAPPEVVPLLFTDGRCNPDPQAPAVAYLYETGIVVYGVTLDGSAYPALVIDQAAIDAAGVPADAHALLGEATSVYGGTIQLWRLTSGEYQLHADELPPAADKVYNAIFETCEIVG
ncbi:MAG: hypothetical protein ACOCXZ_03070 [Chloroflexota bacterium]